MKLAVFALLLVVLPFRASSYVCDTLIVEVKNAKGLDGDGDLSEPDPYVKAMIDGRRKETHVIHDNANPTWNKDLTFTKVKSDMVRVEVWDYDDFFNGADDHRKTCVVKFRPGSFPLTCDKGSSGKLWYGIHCLKGNMKKQKLVWF